MNIIIIIINIIIIIKPGSNQLVYQRVLIWKFP